jgi:hypothetical protein
VDGSGRRGGRLLHVPLTEAHGPPHGRRAATGGRLAGMLWPKERTLDEAEFLDASGHGATSPSDPNAARRCSSSPSRWSTRRARHAGRDRHPRARRAQPRRHPDRVPDQPAHPPGADRGRASTAASRSRTVRAEYWEGAIHPRVELLEETIQTGLVERYENAIGRPFDFDIEEPNLDDAGLARGEGGRLAAWSPSASTPRKASARSGSTTSSGTACPSCSTQTQQTRWSRRRPRLRSDIIDGALPGLQATLTTFLDEQKARVIARLPDVLPKTKAERTKALPARLVGRRGRGRGAARGAQDGLPDHHPGRAGRRGRHHRPDHRGQGRGQACSRPSSPARACASPTSTRRPASRSPRRSTSASSAATRSRSWSTASPRVVRRRAGRPHGQRRQRLGLVPRRGDRAHRDHARLQRGGADRATRT